VDNYWWRTVHSSATFDPKMVPGDPPLSFLSLLSIPSFLLEAAPLKSS